MHDSIANAILKIVQNSGEPLETKEIQEKIKNAIKDVTRTKLFYRLTNLRGEALIKGKFVGPGKGVWIWWTLELFNKGGKNDK